ncbi:MAG TPA: hypothetical protein VJ957_07355 [Longimicrobiales bacterium]|nr:hypothetical protein [Longimicrobiales bacterium]
MRVIAIAIVSMTMLACAGHEAPEQRVAVAGAAAPVLERPVADAGGASGRAGPAGIGRVDYWLEGADSAAAIGFGTRDSLSAVSFRVAWDPGRAVIYVPTPAGRTYVVDPVARRATSFSTIAGGRVAAFALDNDLVLVLSGDSLAGYHAADHRRLFAVGVGGNALVVDRGNDRVFVGGNADSVITQVDLSAGVVARTFPVPRSGDLVLARGRLFSADMKTGVMTSFDPDSGGITHTPTDEVDAAFEYDAIARAKAGFMQLAVSPGGDTVYAAGFSGRILAFDAATGDRAGTIELKGAGPGERPLKLSGLAVLPDGHAFTTAENHDVSFLVDLSSGGITRRFDHVASARWVVLRPAP